MLSLHIVSEPRDSDLPNTEYLTPDEAIGETVEFEIPGQRGRRMWEIVEVEEDLTRVRDVLTEDKFEIGPDSFALDPRSFSRPVPGREYAVWWVEHRTGDGRWVQTCDDSLNEWTVMKISARYEGHEKTRIRKKSHVYLPDGVVEVPVWSRKDEIQIHYDADLDLDPIRASDPGSGRVGEVYVDIREDEIVSSSIPDVTYV